MPSERGGAPAEGGEGEWRRREEVGRRGWEEEKGKRGEVGRRGRGGAGQGSNFESSPDLSVAHHGGDAPQIFFLIFLSLLSYNIIYH